MVTIQNFGGTWSEQLYRYCERGGDPSIWAEPFNVLTNLGFLLAAAMAARHLNRRQKGADPLNANGLLVRYGLIGIVVAIAIGSSGFHLFATRWAQIGDVAPIGLFMLAYLAFALHHFLRLRALPLFASLCLFAAACYVATTITCGGDRPCLNGTLGYLPALLALGAVGFLMLQRGEPQAAAASRWFFLSAGIFALSMLFRTIDPAACGYVSIAGHAIGSHFLWHMANAVTLYLLLHAAIASPGRVAAAAS